MSIKLVWLAWNRGQRIKVLFCFGLVWKGHVALQFKKTADAFNDEAVFVAAE